MAGEHIRKLERTSRTAVAQKLLDSSMTWSADAQVLGKLAETLKTAAKEVERGFADGVTPDPDGTASKGGEAFLALRTKVLERQGQMESAGTVLKNAGAKLAAVEKLRDDPVAAPGPAPDKPPGYGTEESAPIADWFYNNAVSAHDAHVSAYAQRDEEARKALEDLDKAYNEASPVLAKIHGEPVYPEDIPPAGEDGPGGFPSGPGGRVPPSGVVHPTPGPTGVVLPPGVIEGPGLVPGTLPGGEEYGPIGPVGGTITGPGLTPGGGSGGGGGFNPLAAGAVGAGVFGAPGLVNAVKNALGGRGGFGNQAGRLGASSRAGGAPTLGRTGGTPGTPGAPVSRAGGRGAGGQGRSGAGGAGGRGAGGRGVPGAPTAGAGRGRRGKDEERSGERDLFDDGSDWIDDEGAGPGVLG